MTEENNELKVKIHKKDEIIETYDKKFEKMDEETVKYKELTKDIQKRMSKEMQSRIDDMNALCKKRESEYQEKISFQEKTIGNLGN